MKKILRITSVLLLIGMVVFTACDDSNDNYNTSIIKISGTSIDFGSVEIPQQSEVKSYTIAAQDVHGDITIETESPFEISKSEDGGFANTLTISPSEFENNPIIIYVRFTATTEGSYTGTITHTSPDRDNVASVTLTANAVSPQPTITMGQASLIFNGVEVGQASVQSYTISGSFLTAPVTLETTAPFSISLDDEGTYTQNITLQPTDFDEGAITVYVKFSPTESGTYEENIISSSSDFSSLPSVNLTGATTVLALLEMEDDFDYTAGDLPSIDRTTNGATNATLEGWIKVRTANTSIPVVAEGLSYPSYNGAGTGNAIKLDMDTPASNSNVYAYNLENQQEPGAVGSFYSSFLIRIDALPDGGFNRPVMFVDWLDNGATKFLGSLVIDYNGGDARFAARYENANMLTDVAPQVGQTYLVVLKNTVTDSNPDNDNNTVSLFIFNAEDIPVTEPTPNATATADNGNDAYGIKAIAVVKDNNPAGSYVLDGMRVAQTWSDLFN